MATAANKITVTLTERQAEAILRAAGDVVRLPGLARAVFGEMPGGKAACTRALNKIQDSLHQTLHQAFCQAGQDGRFSKKSTRHS